MRIVVRDKLIEVLSQPRSCTEVAEVMGVNYHTARRYVHEMIEQDIVEELPNRNETGSILYKVRTEGVEALEWFFPMGKEMVTLADAAVRVSRFFDAMQNPGSMLGFLAQRSYWLARNQGKEGMDPARRYEGGARGTPVEMRATLRQMAQSLEKVSRLLFAISVRDDVWEADNRVVGSLFERSGWATKEGDMVKGVEAMHAVAESAFLATFPNSPSPSPSSAAPVSPQPVESLMAQIVDGPSEAGR